MPDYMAGLYKGGIGRKDAYDCLMRKPSTTALLVYGVFVIGGGVLVGSGLASSTADKMRRHLAGLDVPDTAAQYRPDVTEFTSRSSNSPRQLTHSTSPVAYEYGKYRNGKRVLVPGEPARKDDRAELAKEMAWQSDSYLNGDMTEPGDLGALPDPRQYQDEAPYSLRDIQTIGGKNDAAPPPESVTVSYGSRRTDNAADDQSDSVQPAARPTDVEK